MDQFVIDDLQYVFRSDGLANSHPIFVPVNHPDEINEIFDRISYSKVSFRTSQRYLLKFKTFPLKLSKSARMLNMSSAKILILNLALFVKLLYEDCITDCKIIMS